jgi:predicted transcriptional regulator
MTFIDEAEKNKSKKEIDEIREAEKKADLVVMGLALKNDLKDRKISPEELARACGLTPMTVYNLIKGKHEPKMDTLCRICDYMKGRE